MKKIIAPTKRRGRKDNKHDISVHAQRKRLLAALVEAGSDGITTFQAQTELNICAPAPRIWELRHEDRRNIKTIRTVEYNVEGFPHNVAKYVLFPGNYEGVN